MWYIGIGPITTSRSTGIVSLAMFAWRVAANRLPWLSTTPLDRPVVPPVYCSMATVSMSATHSGVSMSWPRPSASRKPIGSGRLVFGASPDLASASGQLSSCMSTMLTSTLQRSSLSAATCSATPRSSDIVMIATAPESVSWWANSRSVYSGLVLTITSPARSAPQATIG